jgi:hypothetical protein
MLTRSVQRIKIGRTIDLKSKTNGFKTLVVFVYMSIEMINTIDAEARDTMKRIIIQPNVELKTACMTKSNEGIKANVIKIPLEEAISASVAVR